MSRAEGRKGSGIPGLRKVLNLTKHTQKVTGGRGEDSVKVVGHSPLHPISGEPGKVFGICFDLNKGRELVHAETHKMVRRGERDIAERIADGIGLDDVIGCAILYGPVLLRRLSQPASCVVPLTFS